MPVICQVIEHVLHPCEVGVAFGWYAVLPTWVITELVAAPFGNVKRRICHYKVRFEKRVFVIVERITEAVTEVGFNAANGKVHLCQSPCVAVQFLPVNGYFVDITLVAFNKLTTLHKHTARTTSRVKDFTLVRLDNFDYGTNHARGRVELTTFLAFFASKFSKEIFIYTSEYITSFRSCEM